MAFLSEAEHAQVTAAVRAAEGNSAGEISHLEPMLDEYYRGRGWTLEGVPRPQKLAELGLAELAEGVLL